MRKARKPLYDLGNIIEFTSAFIDDIAADKDCGVTRYDVMYIMLLTLEDEVREYGSAPKSHNRVSKLIAAATDALYKLPVDRRYRRLTKEDFQNLDG
jgi:hypothetical protein